jgi:hypothetical protein
VHPGVIRTFLSLKTKEAIARLTSGGRSGVDQTAARSDPASERYLHEASEHVDDDRENDVRGSTD